MQGLLTPIAQLFMLNGSEPVSVFIPTVAASSDVDSSSTDDFTPGAAAQYDMGAIWSDEYMEGQPQGTIATALVKAPPLLPGLVTSQATLLRAADGVTYTILKARVRVWMTHLDGYTLFLAA